MTSYKSGVITGQSTVNVNTTIDTISLKSAEVEPEFEILVIIIKDKDNLVSVGDVDATSVVGVGVEASTESCLISFLSFEGSAGLLVRLLK